MKEIPLSRGMMALVSDHRFEDLSRLNWWILEGKNGKLYAAHDNGETTILMHRLITGAPASALVDHWDGNGLNNQDENLRVCTYSQNQGNRKINKNNTSGYKGVRADKKRKKWRAEIHHHSHTVSIGSYETPEEAARAYDAKAIEYFGEFARTNF